ncbi:MAG TPA: hypothetical protein VIE64_02070 [Solirubrobacterales bacterium]|jgi:hypothetical protein
MRVDWGAASERFIAQGESLKSSLVALKPGQHGKATEMLRLAGREDMVHINAWRFPNAMLVVLEPAEHHSSMSEPVAQQIQLF